MSQIVKQELPKTLEALAMRRLRGWVAPPGETDAMQSVAVHFELGQLGFRFTNPERFTIITQRAFAQAIEVLKELRGGNVDYVPLFRNFPDELPNDHEYLVRRIFGFFGFNTFPDLSRFGADPVTQMQRPDLWQQAVDEQARRLSDTHTEWIDLTVISREEAEQGLERWTLNQFYGGSPIKEAFWDDLFAAMRLLNIEPDLSQVQVKETLARLAADQWENHERITVRTPTDLLRMFAFLTKQDVSLAERVKFKGLKLSKPKRRAIVAFLDRCPALAEDLLRYRKLWISLSRWIHPGDFARLYPKVAKAFDDLRNDRVRSFESRVVRAEPAQRPAVLIERPSMLIRKLTWLAKNLPASAIAATVRELFETPEAVPLPMLLATYTGIKYTEARAVITKQGKPHTVGPRTELGDLSPILDALEELILLKLNGTKDWTSVWLDPALDDLVLPFQARKQSDGLLNLARGSRIPFDGEVIRIFVYWHQRARTTDLDLSAMKLDDDFVFVDHVGWNNYGEGKDVMHSGDIQSAPLGAAEFIDLRIAALEGGYILPAVLKFAGEPFTELLACHAGWMRRVEVGSRTQIFDPKTVAEKVEVKMSGRCWIPFLFDVTRRELVFVDLYLNGSNMIERNPHFPALARALAAYRFSKPTYGLLARWYIKANGAVEAPRETASVTIGTTDDCTINVFRLVGQGVTSFSF